MNLAGLKYIKNDFQVGVSGTTQKQKIWMDSGIHAREWISITTAMYIIDKVMKGKRTI